MLCGRRLSGTRSDKSTLAWLLTDLESVFLSASVACTVHVASLKNARLRVCADSIPCCLPFLLQQPSTIVKGSLTQQVSLTRRQEVGANFTGSEGFRGQMSR